MVDTRLLAHWVRILIYMGLGTFLEWSTNCGLFLGHGITSIYLPAISTREVWIVRRWVRCLGPYYGGQSWMHATQFWKAIWRGFNMVCWFGFLTYALLDPVVIFWNTTSFDPPPISKEHNSFSPIPVQCFKVGSQTKCLKEWQEPTRVFDGTLHGIRVVRGTWHKMLLFWDLDRWV